MILRVCYFTDGGRALCDRLIDECPEPIIEVKKKEEKLDAWTGECFERHLPILFIGACGIAVRAIAPYVKDKLADSPVLVMDEAGGFVIPILSGHVGGANELAKMIADRLQCTPAITTATDVNDLWSVDVFAVRNGLHIVNREGIRRVSSALLRGETVKVKVDPAIPLPNEELPAGVVLTEGEDADVVIGNAEPETAAQDPEGKNPPLILQTKELVLGMGCRKEKPYEELKIFLEKNGVLALQHSLFALASVDVKSREPGLVGLAQYLKIPFQTYSAEQLNAVEGNFVESDFVREKVGVGNVCERAAICAAGEDAVLLKHKIAEDGMTLAIAYRSPKILTWETK